MKPFLDSNPGIKSRINSTFYFESYLAEEMLHIFQKIAETEHYVVEPGMEADLTKYFESRRLDSHFGNGREARSLLEGSLMAMTRRLFEAKDEKKLTVSDMQLIQAADIKQAIKMAAAANEVQKGRIEKMIGF